MYKIEKQTSNREALGLPPLLVRADVEDERTAQVTAEYMAGLYHTKGYPFLISSYSVRYPNGEGEAEFVSYTAYSDSATWVRLTVSYVSFVTK
jgi:hypothetical protein